MVSGGRGRGWGFPTSGHMQRRASGPRRGEVASGNETWTLGTQEVDGDPGPTGVAMKEHHGGLSRGLLSAQWGHLATPPPRTLTKGALAKPSPRRSNTTKNGGKHMGLQGPGCRHSKREMAQCPQQKHLQKGRKVPRDWGPKRTAWKGLDPRERTCQAQEATQTGSGEVRWTLLVSGDVTISWCFVSNMK